jgi:HPt (histidine-containing phosphotransfer) domain-containing protein
MSYGSNGLVNWSTFSQLRAQLGAEFVRILGYFREDGMKSLIAIEEAMRKGDAAALVRPAHTLKGESLQFGAEPLGLLSEHIEHSARRFVEQQESPENLLQDVAKLRPLFSETINLFERETAPVMASAAPRRPVVFGRKAG